MSTTRSRWPRISTVASLLLLVACGGSDEHAGASDASATVSSCMTNADCVTALPATTPPDCATASCDPLAGHCVFTAKDADGDGHPTASCTAASGTTIVVGDDCDDSDPKLYPGHGESCTPMTDGGGPVTGFCAPGERTCLGNNTVSACENAVICAGQACVDGACTGSCVPGATQCAPGNVFVQMCQADGTWSAGTSCKSAACTQTATGAACTGTCTPGDTLCAGNGVQTCSTSGTWGDVSPCVHMTCTTTSPTSAVCAGLCAPTDTMACNTQSTACNPSSVTCSQGAWPPCPMAIEPTLDGVAVGGACTAGYGACANTGVVSCSGITAVCSAMSGTSMDTTGAYHTVPAPNGSFDWDCDGSVEPEYTYTSTCNPACALQTGECEYDGPPCRCVGSGAIGPSCVAGQGVACGDTVTTVECSGITACTSSTTPTVVSGCR